MGNSRIIPVIVGILILGAVGYSQEVDASHESLKVGQVCSGTGSQIVSSGTELVIPAYDYSLPEHPPCVYYLKDNFVNEGTIYNHGTIIIDPIAVSVINEKTIENYGTITFRTRRRKKRFRLVSSCWYS
jgi:hypothetical protein